MALSDATGAVTRMAEKPDKKPDAGGGADRGAARGGNAAVTAAASGGGLMGKTPALLAAVMVLEAVVLFAGFKMLAGGPQRAAGAELATGEDDGHGGKGEGGTASRPKTVELTVLDFKAPNKVSGRTFLYDVSIYMVVKAEYEKRAKDTLKEREALIKDRVRTIIAQSDPEKLAGGTEPGLETLRRQVKYQLDMIVGEGIVDEVLVPKCIPIRTDF